MKEVSDCTSNLQQENNVKQESIKELPDNEYKQTPKLNLYCAGKKVLRKESKLNGV